MSISSVSPIGTNGYARYQHDQPRHPGAEDTEHTRSPQATIIQATSLTPVAAQHLAAVKSVQGPTELSDEEHRQVEELAERDSEVRRHEMAHLVAAGPHGTGPPRFEYETGPNGKRYAVGGQVKIDTSPVPGDPEATLRKAQILRRAALAPQDPSAKDRQVAAEARALEAQAARELQQQRREQVHDDAPSATENAAQSMAVPASMPSPPSPQSLDKAKEDEDEPDIKAVEQSSRPARQGLYIFPASHTGTNARRADAVRPQYLNQLI